MPDLTEMKLVDAGDVSLSCRETGSGEPLVLICGFSSTMDTWNSPVLAALAGRFRVIVFDNRGTGFSSSSEKPFSLPLFARDTASLMDALGIARAHVLGHSMGAMIAQELALARPDLVDRLVFVSAYCGGPGAVQMQAPVKAALLDRTGSPPEIADRIFPLIFPPAWLGTHDPWHYCPEVRETVSEESAARQAEAFFSWPGTFGRLREIRAPALVITGSDDVVIPPENSVVLYRGIPGAELVSFPGGGHGLMYQFPDEFSRIVTAFLEKTVS